MKKPLPQQGLLADEISRLKGPIAVFGAGGFIGSSLFRALSGYRDDVFAVTHQWGTPYRLHDAPPDKILRADLTNKISIANIYEKHKFKTIFNLSTYGAFERQNETDKIFETNIVGLMNLIGVAEKYGFSAFVQGG